MPATADDRLAFVIETEAHLDGIKKARAEVIGIASDATNAAQAMALADAKSANSTSAASRAIERAFGSRREAAKAAAAAEKDLRDTTTRGTRHMTDWAALNAEAAGQVGQHSLSMGRLEYRMGAAAAEMMGMNRVAELAGASLLKFSLGTIQTVGILAGIYAISLAYDKLTESTRKVTEEQNKAIEAFEKLQREKAQGPEGVVLSALGAQIDEAQAALANPFSHGSVASQKANLARLNADLADALDERAKVIRKNAESTENTYVGNIATLVSYNAHDAAARRTALTEIRRYQNELAALGEGEVTKRAEIISKIKTLNATFEEENKKAAANEEKAMRRLLTRAGQSGDRADKSVDAALDAQEKAQLKLMEGEKRGAAMHADMQARSLELTLQSLGKETEAKLAANDADYMRRQQDIINLDDTETQKTQLFLDNEQQRTAGAAAIRKQAADKEERERQTAEEKIKAAEKRKEKILLNTIDAYVHSSASLQKILIQAALSPLIKELEGTAVRQFVRAAASFAAGDFSGAARHAAAGVLATAGAREVAQLGEMGGGGGRSYGGGAGSGGGGSTFEPRNSTEGQGPLVVNLYSQNPYGNEQIQQVKFLLGRADILKRGGIQIPPTSGLRVA
ncbi:MAG: hypothetical protein M3P26_10250 [Gemmatimonadota bacterium]|nr:hypothetical protein [Gemmatimonadota bacterium]